MQITEYSDIIDARSPAEYETDHIPGAINLPAFNNTERAAVGTLYKNNPFAARRYGAALFSANMTKYLEDSLASYPPTWAPLVYCARGGQRSGGMVEILRRIGWKAEQLCGGYKAYRQHVINIIRDNAKQFRWITLAGKTGVGKTRLLEALQSLGAQTVDLEHMANHRGSVFGAASTTAQPTQRKFESRLFTALTALKRTQPVFIEAESRKIGDIHLPTELLTAIRSATIVHLHADLSARAEYIVNNYQDFCSNAPRFLDSINKLKVFAGNARIRAWQEKYHAGAWHDLVHELLLDFYDIGYEKSLRTNYAPAPRGAALEINPNSETSIQKLALELQSRFCRS